MAGKSSNFANELLKLIFNGTPHWQPRINV